MTDLSQKPTVLYVCPQGRIGGLEKAMIPIVTGHQKYRPVVFLLTPGPLGELLADAGVTVIECPPGLKIRRLGQVYRAIQQCRKLIRSHSVSIVSPLMAWAHLIAAPAAGRNPVCLHQHGPVGGKFERLARWFRPTGVVFNSRQTEASHERLWGKASQKVRVTPVVREFLSPPPLAPAPAGPSQWIGMFGRLSAEKGVRFALEAMAPVLKAHPQWGVMLVGSDWGERAAVESLIERHGLNDQAWLPGEQTDIAPYLLRCDIIVSGSLLPEGFGLSIAEGMRAGKAVLAPGEGGYVEYITPEEDGVLFRPRDSEDFHQQLLSLVRDSDKRKKLGTQAKTKADSLFVKEKAIADLEVFYDRLREAA